MRSRDGNSATRVFLEKSTFCKIQCKDTFRQEYILHNLVQEYSQRVVLFAQFRTRVIFQQRIVLCRFYTRVLLRTLRFSFTKSQHMRTYSSGNSCNKSTPTSTILIRVLHKLSLAIKVLLEQRPYVFKLGSKTQTVKFLPFTLSNSTYIPPFQIKSSSGVFSYVSS